MGLMSLLKLKGAEEGSTAWAQNMGVIIMNASSNRFMNSTCYEKLAIGKARKFEQYIINL